MKYRKLGRTGVKVSEIGFGCGNVGGLIIRGTQRERLQAVRRALELGVNYFDTAPSYGDGQSEVNLGKVLAELKPEATIATKVGLTIDDADDIPNAVSRSVENSLGRLKRESVDVLQLHTRVALKRNGAGWEGALGVEDVLGPGGVADAFDTVRDRGYTRFTGFTGLGEAEALHRLVDSRRFDVVQAYVNLLNPSAGWRVPESFYGYDFRQLIDKASENGLGVAAIRVMAAGALGGEKARRGYAAPQISHRLVPGGEYVRDGEKADRLSFLVQGDTRSLPQAAVRFVLSHPGVSTALVGFSDLQQIEEATTASELGPLPSSQMERLGTLWASNFG